MILVTGATGTIGSSVLTQLVDIGVAVRAFGRTPDRLDSTLGVEFVRGSFDDPVSLDRAMTDASAVFLLTPGGPASVDADLAMVHTARSAGVELLVKLSSIGTGAAFLEGFDWHAPGERAVKESGIPWTVVRSSAFAANALRWSQPVRAGQVIPNLTGGAQQGVVDERDVAAVAVAALTDCDHTGSTYTLTGPELLSTADQVASLGEELGLELETVDVSLDTARQQMLGSGMDGAFVDAAIRGLQVIGEGRNAVLTDDVKRVLGRSPTSFAAWAHHHRDRFLDRDDPASAGLG